MHDRHLAFAALATLIVLTVVLLYAPPIVTKAAFIALGAGLLVSFFILTRRARIAEQELARRHPDELLEHERERIVEHLWLALDKELAKRRLHRITELSDGILRFSIEASPALYRQVCRALRRHGYLEEALRLLEDCIAQGTEDLLVSVDAAFLYSQIGKADRAKSLLATIKHCPLGSEVKPYWTAVWAIAHADQPSDFVDDLSFLRMIVEHNCSADEFAASLALSIAEQQTGSLPKAIQVVRAYLTSEHSRAWYSSREQALLRLGDLYRLTDREQEAKAAFLLASKGRTPFAREARQRFLHQDD